MQIKRCVNATLNINGLNSRKKCQGDFCELTSFDSLRHDTLRLFLTLIAFSKICNIVQSDRYDTSIIYILICIVCYTVIYYFLF